MVLEGHIENGQVVLDEPATLPEGTKVRVEIVRATISDKHNQPTADEFWTFAANLPTTPAEFSTQQATFRQWRSDSRFERHWPMIDLMLTRDFEHTRQWALAAKAVQGLESYDYDAVREQREYDLKHAHDHLP